MTCLDYVGCEPYGFTHDRRAVADGTSSIHDFPLVNGVVPVYTTQDAIISRIGSLASVIEAVDDTGAGQLNLAGGGRGPAGIVLDNLIAAITMEINGYLAPIYPIPPRRRGTVATFQVLTVDSNGVILTFQQPPFHMFEFVAGWPRTQPPQPNGYYQVAPVATAPVATIGGNGSGATMNVAFTAGPPFSITGMPTIASGGTGYVPFDVIGLVGGQSYLPAKVSSAALALCCHGLYARRVMAKEQNLFMEEANVWRGTSTHPGELVKIGRGEVELDADYPRLFSAGVAWVERNRLDMNSL